MQKVTFYGNERPFLGYACQEPHSLDFQQLHPTSMDNQFIPCQLQDDSYVREEDHEPQKSLGSGGGYIHEFRELLCHRPVTSFPGVSRSSIRINPFRGALDPSCKTGDSSNADGTSRCSLDGQLSKQIFPWMKETRQIQKRRAHSFTEAGKFGWDSSEQNMLKYKYLTIQTIHYEYNAKLSCCRYITCFFILRQFP